MVAVGKNIKICLVELRIMNRIEIYQDLARQQQKIWNVRMQVTQLIVGPLETLPKSLGKD